MMDILRKRNAEHIRVFGGGGGVIIPVEIKELMDYGVNRIYSPEDGREMGLEGMIADMLHRADFNVLETEGFSDPTSLETGTFLLWHEH